MLYVTTKFFLFKIVSYVLFYGYERNNIHITIYRRYLNIRESSKIIFPYDCDSMRFVHRQNNEYMYTHPASLKSCFSVIRLYKRLLSFRPNTRVTQQL